MYRLDIVHSSLYFLLRSVTTSMAAVRVRIHIGIEAIVLSFVSCVDDTSFQLVLFCSLILHTEPAVRQRIGARSEPVLIRLGRRSLGL